MRISDEFRRVLFRSKTKLEEKDVEYGIVRLIHLGVVSGYLKDYNRRIFRVDVTNEWLQIHRMPAALAEYLAENFAGFMRRYHLVGGAEQVNLIQIGRASCRERVCQYV